MRADATLRDADDELDALDPAGEAAVELFAVADQFAAYGQLRRATTDVTASVGARVELVRRVFGKAVSAATLRIVEKLAARRWRDGRDLVEALERQGTRSVLRRARREGVLDRVVTELASAERACRLRADLRDALRDARSEAERRGIVRAVFAAADPATVLLMQRAASGRPAQRTRSVRESLAMAADLRGRVPARVRSASELSEAQRDRLRSLLRERRGGEVDVDFEVDPSAVGGLSVSLDGERIDATIQSRLHDLRRRMG